MSPTLTATPRRKPVRKTHQRILDAAIRVFSDRGYHDATMDEIANTAGVAKGTLYYNFPSKTGLFVALVSEGMDGFLNTLNQEAVSELHFHDHFRRLIRVHLDVLIEHIELLTIALNPTVYGFDASTVAVVQEAWTRYLEFLAQQLRKGQEQGYIRAGEPMLMAHEVLGVLGGVLRYYVSMASGDMEGSNRPFRLEWLSEEILRLFSQGLVSESGRAGFLAAQVPTTKQ